MNVETLIKKAKAGDNESFNNLILEYQDTLYRIAKSRLNLEDDVCDAVQNTLISAYRSLNSLENNKYFKTWLIKILINKCNDIYLKDYRKSITYEDIDDYKEVKSEDFTNNFGIDYLIKSLNKDEQTILNLYYIDGYSEKEIAKILNMNYATIRTKIKRAKNKIALELDKEEM